MSSMAMATISRAALLRRVRVRDVLSTCKVGPSALRVKPTITSRVALFSTIDTNHAHFDGSSDNRHEQDSLSSIRTAILKSALDQVHQHGWTEDALAAGTAAVREQQQQHSKSRISMSVVGLLTVDDLIAFCMDQWNIRLKQDLLRQNVKKGEPNSDNNPSVSEKMDLEEELDPLERGIKTRLQYLIPYLQSQRWHEGMALGVRGPSNALQTQAQLREMIQIIVMNNSPQPLMGTPEKLALGAVYVATELHLLTDTSPEYQDTWVFLSQRMNEWRRLTALSSGTGSTATMPSLASSDAVFVATSLASSLVGGLASLIMTNPSHVSNTFGLPTAVWSSLFQNPQSQGVDGTHPSDYDAPKPPSR